ncbi:MAG: 4'-phosphopantetheinyl transferase superfamily protein [Clostridia bacterium]|nr:4'-phosphopantetheinyl transferase superfamily protein [Clostridia bacterium]
MIYLKYVVFDQENFSQNEASTALRDYILYVAFGVKNAKSRVVVGDHGKPYIKGTDFDFSAAHTSGAAVAAVCGKGRRVKGVILIDKNVSRIGVDIEAHSRPLSLKAVRLISNKYFSEKERDYLALCTDGYRERFLEIWTRKESIIKATGKGLSSISIADSFDSRIKYIRTEHIAVKGKKYIVSIAGI